MTPQKIPNRIFFRILGAKIQTFETFFPSKSVNFRPKTRNDYFSRLFLNLIFWTKNWLLEHCVIDSSSQLRVKTTIVCRFQLKVKLSESFLYFSWPFLMIEKGLPQDLLIKNPDFYCRLWCLESQEKFDLISAVPRIHALWTSFSSLFS